MLRAELMRCAVWPCVWPCAGSARMPGTSSASPSTGLTFFHVGNVAWMRWACPRRGCGKESMGCVQYVSSAVGTMISASGNIWALVSFAIRSEMWSPWKCETTMVLDRLRVQAGHGHALREETGFRSAGLSTAGPGIDQDQAVAALHGQYRERDRHMRRRSTARLQRLLGLIDGHALDEIRYVAERAGGPPASKWDATQNPCAR